MSPAFYQQAILALLGSKQSVNKACGHVVFSNSSQVLRDCADLAMSLNSACFTCQSWWSYLICLLVGSQLHFLGWDQSTMA